MKKIDMYLSYFIFLLLGIGIFLLYIMRNDTLFAIAIFFIAFMFNKLYIDLMNTKMNMMKISSNYITKLTFEQFVKHVDDIIIQSLTQAIKEDVSEPHKITRKERYNMIIQNTLIRFTDKFSDDLDMISLTYGENYLMKHFNFTIDYLISTNELDKLISKFSSTITLE